ncbi:hypothetical protein Zmor_016398 [Zophobas morio]|uniref:Uncharacterized protein n=1 Tax=Zophobas morio TaxID=2755281 RepID=A0AA38HGX4_9CUCU|nr:hypothetical protein Zmor_016398 [Zophobas morio]
MPVLQRALKDHSTSIKTQACRILGIMAGLADVKDLSYYFGDVIPRLQVALVDSNPEVRAESARALGLLASGMVAPISARLPPCLITISATQSG